MDENRMEIDKKRDRCIAEICSGIAWICGKMGAEKKDTLGMYEAACELLEYNHGDEKEVIEARKLLEINKLIEEDEDAAFDKIKKDEYLRLELEKSLIEKGWPKHIIKKLWEE